MEEREQQEDSFAQGKREQEERELTFSKE